VDDNRGVPAHATLPTACATCDTDLRAGAKFCDECGTPIALAPKPAEYKQVTVLFADVVHSMELAATLGAERLREIMTELVNRSTKVVEHLGGMVDKFTGDGVMAVFGAPVALEDHSVRACLAALDIQDEVARLSAEVEHRDGVSLMLRIGLNSGEVITGEIGSGALGYTAVGEHVGMAQRMESVAPSGAVMVSESTARLVRDVAVLGEPEAVHIKGSDERVPARRLLSMAVGHEHSRRTDPTLVGRTWELNNISGLLDEAIGGAGSVISVVGPPGIGKSRMVREAAALAAGRGVEVFTTYCESHASDIPFHVVAPLLRAGFGVDGLDATAARAHVRTLAPDADPENLLLLDDLLGIADPDNVLPNVDAGARRRRLTALVNGASLTRQEPGIFVVEDAHWIDEVSESMLADFLAVVPQTHSVVLITYRPEYNGALAKVNGAQTIALRPLSDAQAVQLIGELLGPDSSVTGVAALIAERVAGNPFFAEEIVRDLAERGVLRGERGAYTTDGDLGELGVPATLQATIAARIDRLDEAAKRTLSAAAVIGMRFDPDLLASLGTDAEIGGLVEAELVDQVMFTPRSEFAFRHPLVRKVAYESQLKTDRAELHRRLAAAIEHRNPGSLDENAALIAEHLEAAGDLREAFGWHMRAGTWSTNRDITAARLSWQRARQVADRLPEDDPGRIAMRIAPRTLLCLSSWRAGGRLADTGFDELRELAGDGDDKVSLAIGMAGQASALLVHGCFQESSRLATELTGLIESLGDPTLTVGLLYVALGAKYQVGEATEVLRLAQLMIDTADGDAKMGDLIIGSPLITAITLRGLARGCLGDRGWRDDVDRATAMVRDFDPTMRGLMMLYKYSGIGTSIRFDATALQETAELLEVTERCGDELAVACARFVRGLTLVRQGGPQRAEGFELLAQARESAARERFTMVVIEFIDLEVAKEKARTGDVDGAVEIARVIVEREFDSGETISRAPAVSVLVELLLQRGTDDDLREAQAAVDRLAAVPTEPGYIVYEISLLRLRALLARAHGDEAGYRDYADRYRRMATSLRFEGHMALAEAMT
jgi:adenylate cyclase